MEKLVVLGFDGLDPELVEKYIADLPNIRAIVQEGFFGKLNGLVPPITSGAWTSMVTGKNPGKTGILGFFERIATGEFRPVHSINVRHPKIWDVVTQAGGQSIILNMPLTGGVNELNGIYASGRFGSFRTYPPNLKEEIEARGYTDAIPVFSDFDDVSEFVDHAIELEEHRLKVALDLIASHEADFIFMVFNIPDTAHHYLDDDDLILRLYKYVDEVVGRFAAISTNLFVVSDHGFGKQPVDYRVNLLQLLADNGFVKLDGLKRSVKFKSVVRHVLANLGIYPGNATSEYRMVDYNVDWDQTVIDLPPDFTAMHVNRESVVFGDIDTLHQELRVYLEKLEYNTQAYKSQLYKREDLYHGENLHKLPEFVFVGSTRLVFRDRYTGGPVFSSPGIWKTVHDSALCFLGTGSMIKQGAHTGGKIYDIAPTILHALGLPTLEDMDGEILDIFSEEHKKKYEGRSSQAALEISGASLPLEDQREIEERLRDLGYI